MRYCLQPDNYTCGPVAIINLLKWLGVRATLKGDLAPMKELTWCTSEEGSEDTFIERLAKLYSSAHGCTFQKRKNPSIKTVRNHLRKGGSIIWLYDVRGEFVAHYTFIYGWNESYYKIANGLRSKQVTHDFPNKRTFNSLYNTNTIGYFIGRK